MKTKTLKIVTTILMALFVLCTISQVVFGATVDVKDVPLPTEILGIAGTVVGLIRAITVVATVVLVAVFGFKFVMGSANEKADYQKSFVPLIIGVIVVFASTYIADFLLETFKN